MLERYGKEYPKEAGQLQHIMKGTLPDGWDAACKEFPADPKGLATRQSSEKARRAGRGGVTDRAHLLSIPPFSCSAQMSERADPSCTSRAHGLGDRSSRRVLLD